MFQGRTIEQVLNCGIAIDATDVEGPVIEGDSRNARECVELNSAIIHIPPILLVENYRIQFGKYVQEIFCVL